SRRSRSGAKPSAGRKRPSRRRSASAGRRLSRRPQAALDNARREHEEWASAIEAERTAIDERAEAEDDRWARQKEKLEEALHQTLK
ncbi:MAG TPA: hypothetical protein VE690_16435, partial [Rhodopila sp.]|nr:hypothetical protein [Rhodopila sp.]